MLFINIMLKHFNLSLFVGIHYKLRNEMNILRKI